MISDALWYTHKVKFSYPRNCTQRSTIFLRKIYSYFLYVLGSLSVVYYICLTTSLLSWNLTREYWSKYFKYFCSYRAYVYINMEVVKKFFLKFVFTSQTRFGSQKWYPSNILKSRGHIVTTQSENKTKYVACIIWTILPPNLNFKNKYHSTATNWNK